MSRPKYGEISAAAPAEAVSIEIANAALAPPKRSIGSEYRLTLSAAAARKLTEIASDAQATVGVDGITAAASDRAAASTQTRNLARGAATPRRIQTIDIQPPANPPAAASAGGIHAHHLACSRLRPRART